MCTSGSVVWEMARKFLGEAVSDVLSLHILTLLDKAAANTCFTSAQPSISTTINHHC